MLASARFPQRAPLEDGSRLTPRRSPANAQLHFRKWGLGERKSNISRPQDFDVQMGMLLYYVECVQVWYSWCAYMLTCVYGNSNGVHVSGGVLQGACWGRYHGVQLEHVCTWMYVSGLHVLSCRPLRFTRGTVSGLVCNVARGEHVCDLALEAGAA